MATYKCKLELTRLHNRVSAESHKSLPYTKALASVQGEYVLGSTLQVQLAFQRSHITSQLICSIAAPGSCHIAPHCGSLRKCC